MEKKNAFTITRARPEDAAALLDYLQETEIKGGERGLTAPHPGVGGQSGITSSKPGQGA